MAMKNSTSYKKGHKGMKGKSHPMYRHGFCGTHIYSKWRDVVARCNNPKHASYANYGGRGIKVCERWRDFTNFYQDVQKEYKAHVKKYGERDTTIERKDNFSDYEPNNVTWVRAEYQNKNKRNVVRYVYNGKEKTVPEIAKETNLKYDTLIKRLAKGLSLKEAVSKPVVHKVGSVTYDKSRKKWRVQCGKDSKKKFIGRFNTKKEAQKVLSDYIKNYDSKIRRRQPTL